MNKPTIEELQAQVKQLAAENAFNQEFISAASAPPVMAVI